MLCPSKSSTQPKLNAFLLGKSLLFIICFLCIQNTARNMSQLLAPRFHLFIFPSLEILHVDWTVFQKNQKRHTMWALSFSSVCWQLATDRNKEKQTHLCRKLDNPWWYKSHLAPLCQSRFVCYRTHLHTFHSAFVNRTSPEIYYSVSKRAAWFPFKRIPVHL